MSWFPIVGLFKDRYYYENLETEYYKKSTIRLLLVKIISHTHTHTHREREKENPISVSSMLRIKLNLCELAEIREPMSKEVNYDEFISSLLKKRIRCRQNNSHKSLPWIAPKSLTFRIFAVISVRTTLELNQVVLVIFTKYYLVPLL